MATIIDQTYFTKAELKLPIDNVDAQDYIDIHEPEILKKVLGYALSKEFQAALADTPAQKWLDLRDGKDYTDFAGNLQQYEGIKSIIADYVFVQIVGDKQNYTTDSGVKMGSTENAENTSPRYKQVFAQNDMVDRIVFLDEFINVTNSDTPDTYENYLPTTQEKGNIFNI